MDEQVRRLHAIIDERIGLALGAPPVQLERGTVASVVESLRIAMVTLGAGDTPVPITYASLPMDLVPGDEVVVLRRPDGWLLVLAVLGRDAPAGGGGGSHDDLTGVSPDDHHAQAHALVGGDHTASGLTAGHVVRASGATTFGFAQLGHGDLSGLTTGDPHTQYLTKALADAAGDLLVASANDAWARLALGGAGTVLTSSGGTAAWEQAVVGQAPFALPLGLPLDAVSNANTTLTAVSGGNGGAVAIAFPIPSPMKVQALGVWNTDTTLLRSVELRLFQDNGDATFDFLTGTDATLSFTPTVASWRQGNIATPGTLIKPGVVWLVIRNTSASNAFNLGRVNTGTLLSAFNVRRGANVAALGATVDISAWTAAANGQIVAAITGRIGAEAAGF
jgi:hypothetical protein